MYNEFKTDYKFTVLQEAVTDYLYEEEERRCFLKTWNGGWWESKTAKEREDYTKHEERTNGKWNTVTMMCRMLDVDVDRVIPIVKAISRYEKNHGKYDRCFHFDWRYGEYPVKRFISNEWKEKQHYESTGRRIIAN